jgi:transcriptional regulator with XRE-family HTH domain
VGKQSVNSIDKHVGSRVRMRRNMLGLSQTKLGSAVGVTFQQLQKYEKGINRIGASRLHQIAHVLQVPIAFFYEGAPRLPGHSYSARTEPMPTYVTEFLATPDGLALTKAYSSIKSSKLRRCILHLVEDVTSSRRL